MIKSMTGFSHREIALPLLRCTMDLKSYNSRYLDISISLPSQLSSLESNFRSFLAARIIHGKVDFTLRITENSIPAKTTSDLAAAMAIATVLRNISEACKIEEPLKLSDLLHFDGVVVYEREFDTIELWSKLEAELSACFSDYDESRIKEGLATKSDIERQLERISIGLDRVKANVPEIEQTIKTQFRTRFKELMGDTIDENRILAETATLLMKFSIHEEVSRLGAHIESFRHIIDEGNAPGKKLDFLCQEMNREVNTIGSKNMLLPIAQVVVEQKDAMENIREQLRNLE